MKNFKIIALVCAISCMHSTSTENNIINLNGRWNEAKDKVVKTVSAYLVMVNGDKTIEAQQRRLQIHQKLEDNRIWQWWSHHPKSWITWVVTGSLPIKNVDNRIRDEEYVQHFLVYKSLLIGRALTDEEKISAVVEAMQLLNTYKSTRRIR